MKSMDSISDAEYKVVGMAEAVELITDVDPEAVGGMNAQIRCLIEFFGSADTQEITADADINRE